MDHDKYMESQVGIKVEADENASKQEIKDSLTAASKWMEENLLFAMQSRVKNLIPPFKVTINALVKLE